MFALIARTQQTTMLDGYIEYGAGDFDGQNSGHDYYGVSFLARRGATRPERSEKARRTRVREQGREGRAARGSD